MLRRVEQVLQVVDHQQQSLLADRQCNEGPARTRGLPTHAECTSNGRWDHARVVKRGEAHEGNGVVERPGQPPSDFKRQSRLPTAAGSGSG